jgi:hypothetical protein
VYARGAAARIKLGGVAAPLKDGDCLIQAQNSLALPFNSLFSRNKFPVSMCRELLRKLLISRCFSGQFMPFGAQTSLEFPVFSQLAGNPRK